jgi:hypothetical protein
MAMPVKERMDAAKVAELLDEVVDARQGIQRSAGPFFLNETKRGVTHENTCS